MTCFLECVKLVSVAVQERSAKDVRASGSV